MGRATRIGEKDLGGCAALLTSGSSTLELPMNRGRSIKRVRFSCEAFPMAPMPLLPFHHRTAGSRWKLPSLSQTPQLKNSRRWT